MPGGKLMQLVKCFAYLCLWSHYNVSKDSVNLIFGSKDRTLCNGWVLFVGNKSEICILGNFLNCILMIYLI